jgi:hypothetical protein
MKILLGDILTGWKSYALDDSIYLPAGVEPKIDTPASVLPFDRTRGRSIPGQVYFLGIEQVRDVVEGLEGQLGRAATPSERLRAAVLYARHDAFIDPGEASGP